MKSAEDGQWILPAFVRVLATVQKPSLAGRDSPRLQSILWEGICF